MKSLSTPKESLLLSQRDWLAGSGGLVGGMRRQGATGGSSSIQNPLENEHNSHFSAVAAYSTMEISLTPCNNQREHQDDDGNLIGVLRQVSEMTMSDTRLLQTPLLMFSTPATPGTALVNMLCQTPDQGGNNHTPTPDRTRAYRAFSKRNPSPMFHDSKSSSVFLPDPGCDADARVLNAPPLPSSPELSSGGLHATIRAVLPQFSPIANFHPVNPPDFLPPLPAVVPQFRVPSPRAPPQVLMPIGDNNVSPPPMPWMDTPENPGRRQVFPMKMRRSSGNGLCLSALHFSG